MIQKIFKEIMKRKIISLIVLAILVGGGFFGYKNFFSKQEETRYVLGTVEKGTLITSVSGSGQISASNQVEIKAKASGDVISVAVHDGQEVKKDDILASIDARDAKKTVRDAQVNLESARIALKKLLQPPDAHTLLQSQYAVEGAKNALKKLLKPADEDTLLAAENAVVSARDALEKLKLSQPDEYQKMAETKEKAQDNLAKAYDDAFNAIANDFVSLPTIMTSLYDILYSDQIGVSEITIGRGQWNISALLNTTTQADSREKLQSFATNAETGYRNANASYISTLSEYKNTTRFSSRESIDALLSKTLTMTKSINQATKSESDFLNAWSDFRIQSGATVFVKVKEYQTNMTSYISQTNTHISTLLGIQRTIQDNLESITSAERSLKQMDQNNPLDLSAAEALVKQKESARAKLKAGADSLDIANAKNTLKERESALAKLKSGVDAIDIQSQQLSVKQRENALFDAQEKLKDYTVRAPFDGIVAKVNVTQGDPASSSAALVTFITKQRTADVSLNEVDVAKIKTGQKATLAFDAIQGLSPTGEVAEIDTIGTVSQGVVTYNVKIVFDTQDERVKPGMSINASVITNIRSDILMIPNSALKTRGESQIVELLDEPLLETQNGQQGVLSKKPPRAQPVETGLSNDTSTEIFSGLSKGEKIIIRTIKTAEKTNGSQAPSIFGTPGGGGRNFGGATGAGGGAMIRR